VRHYDCELLVPCCSIYKVYKCTRASKLVHRVKQPALQDITLSGHINDCYLQSPELRKSESSLQQKCRRNMQKRIDRLKNKLGQAVQSKGVVLNDSDHKEILISEYLGIKKKYLPDSFERLFWEQQLKASNCKDPCQIHWHPTINKWCLYIRRFTLDANLLELIKPYRILVVYHCHLSIHCVTTHIALRLLQDFQMM